MNFTCETTNFNKRKKVDFLGVLRMDVVCYRAQKGEQHAQAVRPVTTTNNFNNDGCATISVCKPVCQHSVAFVGDNGFRVELYAANVVLAVGNAHDDAVFRY